MEGTHRRGITAEQDERLKAAGLLLQMARVASGLTQREVARRTGISEDRISDYEKGLLPTQEGRPRYLRLIQSYGLSSAVANRFLDLVGQGPLSADERQRAISVESGAQILELVLPGWDTGLSDRDLEEVALVLNALREGVERHGALRQPIANLCERFGEEVARALIDRGIGSASTTRGSSMYLEPIESLLAVITDDKVKDLDRRVNSYIARGVHDSEEEVLAGDLRDLLRLAPKRWRPHVRYLLGRLQDYSQSYLESTEELSRAVTEFNVAHDEVDSLRVLADATYSAGMAYMSVGDREAFARAQSYFRRAESLYEDIDLLLPAFREQTLSNRLDVKLQRARVLTWGFRRGMGPRFTESESIHRELLEDAANQEVLVRSPFFQASVWKERADNLRVSTEADGSGLVPELAVTYFRHALLFYDQARLQSRPEMSERIVECYLNKGYIYRLLGENGEARREMSRAHRLALKTGLVRQIGHTLLHMAESDWRNLKSRVFCAYVGANLSARIGTKRNEEVCRKIVQDNASNLSPDFDYVAKAAHSTYAARGLI